MILHRDGIVGEWKGAQFSGPPFLQNQAENLQMWEAWVRSATVDFEFLSDLRFTWDPGVETGGKTTGKKKTAATPNGGKQKSASGATPIATLWHIDATSAEPNLKCAPLVSMIAPTVTTFKEQLNLVNGYSDLRADRASEIVAQLSPPIAFWSSVMHLHPARHRWTIELLEAALRLATYVEMRFKHAFSLRRPLDYSPQVQPMILTPGHGTLPSGHATEAHLIASLLRRLGADAGKDDKVWLEQLMRQAARIAINRTVAGVHFPVDSAAGQMLGLTLAEYLLARANEQGGTQTAWRFDGTKYGVKQDFNGREQFDTDTGQRRQPAWASQVGAAAKVNSSPMLVWLWQKASDEWVQGLG